MTEDMNDIQGTGESSDGEVPPATGRDGKPWEDWGSSESFTHGYDPDGTHFKRDR